MGPENISWLSYFRIVEWKWTFNKELTRLHFHWFALVLFLILLLMKIDIEWRRGHQNFIQKYSFKSVCYSIILSRNRLFGSRQLPTPHSWSILEERHFFKKKSILFSTKTTQFHSLPMRLVECCLKSEIYYQNESIVFWTKVPTTLFVFKQ